MLALRLTLAESSLVAGVGTVTRVLVDTVDARAVTTRVRSALVNVLYKSTTTPIQLIDIN